MTNKEIEQCLGDWQRTEMSDLEFNHLNRERLAIYNKWFSQLLSHARFTIKNEELTALVEEIYDWTSHKNTDWAKRAAKVLKKE